MEQFKNSMTGEIRTKEGWWKWTQDFYKQIGYLELTNYTKTHPPDWWERVQRVLKLEAI